MTVPVISRRRAEAARRQTLLTTSKITGGVAAAGAVLGGAALVARKARGRREVFSEDDLRPAAVTTIHAIRPTGRFVREAEKLDEALAAAFPASELPGYP